MTFVHVCVPLGNAPVLQCMQRQYLRDLVVSVCLKRIIQRKNNSVFVSYSYLSGVLSLTDSLPFGPKTGIHLGHCTSFSISTLSVSLVKAVPACTNLVSIQVLPPLPPLPAMRQIVAEVEYLRITI